MAETKKIMTKEEALRRFKHSLQVKKALLEKMKLLEEANGRMLYQKV